MYRSTWYELNCPQCNSTNFVNDGDTQDSTLPDIEAFKCWNCNHCFDFEGNPVDEDDLHVVIAQNWMTRMMGK